MQFFMFFILLVNDKKKSKLNKFKMGECCLSEFDFEIEATQLSEIGKSKLILNPTDFSAGWKSSLGSFRCVLMEMKTAVSQTEKNPPP